MQKSLLDQLNTVEIELVALLCGVDTVGPSFTNYLRECPAIEEGFTIGRAAELYLSCRLNALTRIGKRNEKV